MGRGELGEKGEGIEKYSLVVKNSHGGLKYNIGDIVSNILIAVYGTGWVLAIRQWGGPLCKVYDCLSTMLYT